MGMRRDAAAVPEPVAIALVLAAACLIASRIRAVRWRLCCSYSRCVLALTMPAHADIYRWGTDR